LETAPPVVDERSGGILPSIAATLLISAVCWATAPFCNWLTRHETSCWLVLAALWYVWLDPSWFGLAIAVWAGSRAFFRSSKPISIGAGSRAH